MPRISHSELLKMYPIQEEIISKPPGTFDYRNYDPCCVFKVGNSQYYYCRVQVYGCDGIVGFYCNCRKHIKIELGRTIFWRFFSKRAKLVCHYKKNK